jgi:hypothetical protein
MPENPAIAKEIALNERRAEHVRLGCPKRIPLGEPGHTMCWRAVGVPTPDHRDEGGENG